MVGHGLVHLRPLMEYIYVHSLHFMCGEYVGGGVLGWVGIDSTLLLRRKGGFI